MEQAVKDLLGMLRAPNPVVRKGAAETVLGLTGSEDGRELLIKNNFPQVLAKIIGDQPSVSAPAVKSLVNLCNDDACRKQLLENAGLVDSLMENLKDPECTFRRAIVMLLANLSMTEEGCNAILQVNDTRKGLNFRRIIQWIVSPPPGSGHQGGPRALASFIEDDERDEFEYGCAILANVTRHDIARQILLEPERRILPVLFSQLAARSTHRRRGISATLRNCCFERNEKELRYMLAPSVDIITALLLPLSGSSKEYAMEERVGMNSALYGEPLSNQFPRITARETDPATRRNLIEGLYLLTRTRQGRDALRDAKAYFVVRNFHYWMEGVEVGEDGTPVQRNPANFPGQMVGSGGSGDEKTPAEGGVLHPDDEAAVDTINLFVQQIFLEDEYDWSKHPKNKLSAVPERASSDDQNLARDETLMEAMLGKTDSETYKSALRNMLNPEVAARLRKYKRFQTVPLEEARAIARRIATAADVDATEDDDMITPIPDWRAADPDVSVLQPNETTLAAVEKARQKRAQQLAERKVAEKEVEKEDVEGKKEGVEQPVQQAVLETDKNNVALNLVMAAGIDDID